MRGGVHALKFQFHHFLEIQMAYRVLGNTSKPLVSTTLDQCELCCISRLDNFPYPFFDYFVINFTEV
jgi:hypothetical protein